MSNRQENTSTVLVVEDDRDAREVYALVLQVEGYSVVVADNGSHALKVMESHHIDVILTDFLMPVMDGLDFATRIKSDSRYEKIPIVLLSARDLEEECKEVDVFSALLRKPCSADDLTSALAKALSSSNIGQ